MAVRTYNSSVLVGNWCEDVQLTEDMLKDFLEKRGNGELMMQKTEGLMGAVNGKGGVSVAKAGSVFVGAKVVLVNKSSSEEYADCCLNLCITVKHLTAADPQSVPPETSGGPACQPTLRNVLTVVSASGEPEGSLIRYGEPFFLQLQTFQGNFYVKSEAKTPMKASKKARHNEVTFVLEPSSATQFKAQYFDPRLRMEYDHQPVAANERVIITHKDTNQALAVERAYKQRTLFGWEYEITCHTYRDCHSAETDANHWMFVMEVPGSQFSPGLNGNN